MFFFFCFGYRDTGKTHSWTVFFRTSIRFEGPLCWLDCQRVDRIGTEKLLVGLSNRRRRNPAAPAASRRRLLGIGSSEKNSGKISTLFRVATATSSGRNSNSPLRKWKERELHLAERRWNKPHLNFSNKVDGERRTGSNRDFSSLINSASSLLRCLLLYYSGKTDNVYAWFACFYMVLKSKRRC